MSAVRRLFHVDGLRSEALYIQACQGASRAVLQILIIPGNPGAASYYVPFMMAFRDLFEGHADITTLSQLGHGYDHGKQLFSLREQVAHKAAYMREHMLLPGRPPAIVIGHSIGAYMAVQAVKAIEMGGKYIGPAICKVVALYPFLAVDPLSFRQKVLKAGTVFPSALGTLLGLLGLLPGLAQQAIVSLVSGGMDKHGLMATTGLFRFSTGRSVAYLGRTEFQDLNRLADWDAFRRLGEQCLACYAINDTWFPHSHYNEMRSQLPDLQILATHGLKHGFCCSVEQSQALARLLHPILQQAL